MLFSKKQRVPTPTYTGFIIFYYCTQNYLTQAFFCKRYFQFN